MRDARFDELDALIAATPRIPGRPPGRTRNRTGFAALDRGDDERLRRKMMRAPYRENGFAQKIQHTWAWAKRRAKDV